MFEEMFGEMFGVQSVGPERPRSQQAATTTTRRLSRSAKLSQHTPQSSSDPNKPQQAPSAAKSEFKTPTRPRVFGASGGESPHDADVPHDIIWDATSPQRFGKRPKKQPPGVVNISDIVSRIAPEHGRPQVSEPALQQWIGDSAGIPCTPDVQPPKSRRKSPRSNGVDNLLKLAKRFDLNLIGRDDPADDLEGARRPSDDVSFLVDEAAGQAEHFPDDWGDDDLLDDLLLAEMTQDPENFSAPQHSSTQKTSDQAGAPPSSVSQSDGRTTLDKLGTCPANFQPFSSKAAGKDLPATRAQSAAVSMETNKCSSPGTAHEQVPAVLDFSDDDLDVIFSSEPPWDDPADDEMLRELCEDLENRIGAEAADRAQGKDSAAGRLEARPVVVTTPLPQRQQFTFKRPGESVSTATNRPVPVATNHLVPMVTSKPVSAVTNGPISRVNNYPVSMATHHLVSVVTSKAVAKCSALEIERKKRQAVERRRRRLQGVQNIK